MYSQEEIDNLAIEFNKIDLQDPNSQKRIREILNALSFLVKNRCWRYKRFSNCQDLEQEGFEALIQAFKTFKIDKSAFTWWADKYIKTRITRAANSHAVVKVPLRIAKNQKPLKESLPTLVDLNNPEKTALKREIASHILRCLQKFSSVDQNIFIDYFGLSIDQLSIDDLATKYCKSTKQIYASVKLTKKKLQKHLFHLME